MHIQAVLIGALKATVAHEHFRHPFQGFGCDRKYRALLDYYGTRGIGGTGVMREERFDFGEEFAVTGALGLDERLTLGCGHFARREE